MTKPPNQSQEPPPSTSPEEYWPNEAELVFDQLTAAGWRPEPISLFIFKIHARCNLNCTYCYMYNSADQSWRQRPKRMELDVAEQSAVRIREHARVHGLRQVGVSFHGGEPVLVGASYLGLLAQRIRDIVGDAAQVDFVMQTNGTLLTEAVADVLIAEQIRVGISLDGPPDVNDQYRIYRNGQASHAAVQRGIELLRRPQYHRAYSGFLCVVLLGANPIEVYRHLRSFDPPGIDFILPLGNWTTPPPGKHPPFENAPYADWLIPIFDAWYDESPKQIEIRLFSEIINLVLGGKSSFEAIGLNPGNLIVIESDGTFEGVDTLKSTFDGAANLALNVFNHSVDEVMRRPAIMARQVGLMALHSDCMACDLHQICGAGYYPHRYRAGNGFRNRSVYCSDLMKLIRHIRGRIVADLKLVNPRSAGHAIVTIPHTQ